MTKCECECSRIVFNMRLLQANTHQKKTGKETMKLIVNSKLQFYVNTLKDKDSINCTFLNFNVIHMLKLEEN